MVTASPILSVAASTEPVDAAIVLAVDVSDSVSQEEYELQRHGIAKALRDPDVGRLLEQCNANGVALTFIEWAGFHQKMRLFHEIKWEKLTTAAELNSFAERFDSKRARRTEGFTDIINALRFSSELLVNAPFEARRKYINVSGDGGQNVSPPNSVGHMSRDEMAEALRKERDAIVSAGIVIDALVIPNRDDEREKIGPLDQYFLNNVIGGRGSNLRTVNDLTDYANGLKANLLAEMDNCLF